MGIWDTVLTLVKDGKIIASDAAILVNAGIGAYHEVQSGKTPNPLIAMINQSPAVLPILESVLNYVFPGAGTGLEVLAFILSNSHKMTPEEEKKWFDRASQVSGL